MKRVKQKTKILAFILTAFCVYVFLIPNTSLAMPFSFSISPQKFYLEVFPGGKFQSKISINNKSDVPVPFSVRALTFDASENTGQMIFLPPGELERSPGRWFEFETPGFILEPQEEREIFFKISVPQKVNPGGFSAFIFFEPKLPEHFFEEGVARAIPAIGAPVLISVKSFYLDSEPRDDLEVVEFSLSPEERIAFMETILKTTENIFLSSVQAANIQTVSKKPSIFNLRIKNNSSYLLRPKGTAVVKNFLGKTVGEINISEKTILPGKIRMFPVELKQENSPFTDWLPASISNFLSQNTFIGRYEVDLNISSSYFVEDGRGSAKAASTLILYSFPKAGIIFIFTILLILFLLVFKHRRLKLAFKTLFKKPVDL